MCERCALDRRAVDVAVFNAQGERDIFWWPLYSDMRAGDLVLLRLAAHPWRPFDEATLEVARGFVGMTDVRLPKHPLVTERRESETIYATGYQGVAVVAASAYRRAQDDRWEGRVGHIVPFPKWIDQEIIRELVGDDAVLRLPPETPVEERRSHAERWFANEAGTALLSALEEGDPRLGGDFASIEFRASVRNLRAVARRLRRGEPFKEAAQMAAWASYL
jgi:hypothetical protein